jgi:hypothetical protein
MKNKIILIIITLLLSSNSIAQIPRSNFSIFVYKGFSQSNAKIKNPFWLSDKDILDHPRGNAYGIELNQRVVKGFWVGVGMQFNNRNYSFNRIDPYNPNINTEKFIRKDFGQDFSIKGEYFYPYKKINFSALVRYKTQIWLQSRSSIYQNSLISKRNESNFLASGYRKRLEYGVSATRYFTKNKLWSIRLEGNYSHFNDIKKSNIIDKMDIRSLSAYVGITRNFKPVLYKLFERK